MIKVLFVCLGNICRSPTAEGVFQAFINQDPLLRKLVSADSAGTAAYHAGEPPDIRAQNAAKKRGYDLSYIRARRVNSRDFEEFDYILAMDKANYEDLVAICPELYQEKIRLFLAFNGSMVGPEMPDPYYGSLKGFEHVLDLAELGAKALMQEIKSVLREQGKMPLK